jgi:endonuclease G, mitochondrial
MKSALLLTALVILQTGCIPADEAGVPDPIEGDSAEPGAPSARDSVEPGGLSAPEAVEAAAAATRDDNLAMGNPSGATTSTSNKNNFLMVKPQYALSYNNSRGAANWVSWHLSSAWKGSAPRSNSFKIDTSLPTGFLRVSTSFYTNSGFDRGHLCPSEDRDASTSDNVATFLMTNITPQAPDNNRITWLELENYARKLVTEGNELYIVAGGRDSGGQGSSGSATTIHSGDVTVPSHLWKVLVVLPVGSNDVSRVTSSTRVIAVDMPNNQSVDTNNWGAYRVSVDALESLTGFDFFSNVSASVQSVVESKVDNGPINLERSPGRPGDRPVRVVAETLGDHRPSCPSETTIEKVALSTISSGSPSPAGSPVMSTSPPDPRDHSRYPITSTTASACPSSARLPPE